MDCSRCTAYEEAVMARAPDDPEPDAPCDHYAMSPRFQAWIVDRMQGEVRDQVQASGLDRMAMVKADP